MRFLPVAGFVLALVLVGAAIWQIMETPGSVIGEPDLSPEVTAAPGPPVVVPINSGESPDDIGKKLEAAGVIESALHFRILVSLLGYEGLLQAGDYEFDQGISTLEAAQRIRHGRTGPLQATIPEGLRREEIAAILEQEGVIAADAFLAAAVTPYDFDFLGDLPPATSLEGYLFPATYSFRRNMAPEEVVRTFLEAFDQNFSLELRQEAQAKGLGIRDVVSLASVIEREAQLPEERPIMAQVFLKRLRTGIPLEADPTVQYALANDPASVAEHGYWKQGLTIADLGVDSPYNTYLNNGLPPGPIGNPGIDAIIAVIRPTETNYLYFVAKPDGSHAFAETLEEHQQNIELYQ